MSRNKEHRGAAFGGRPIGSVFFVSVHLFVYIMNIYGYSLIFHISKPMILTQPASQPTNQPDQPASQPTNQPANPPPPPPPSRPDHGEGECVPYK